ARRGKQGACHWQGSTFEEVRQQGCPASKQDILADQYRDGAGSSTGQPEASGKTALESNRADAAGSVAPGRKTGWAGWADVGPGLKKLQERLARCRGTELLLYHRPSRIGGQAAIQGPASKWTAKAAGC